MSVTNTIIYLGGISSGNVLMGVFRGLGSAGLLVLSCITSWTSWISNQTQHYGVYRTTSSCWGYRTLWPGCHKFMCAWAVGDSLITFSLVLAVAFRAMAVVLTPLVVWMELIVRETRIESATDWISVCMFVAQAVAL